MFCCFGKKDAAPEGPERVKMVVVGDGDCGKTCLLYRFLHQRFFSRHIPTVFEVECKTVSYEDREVQLVMYDTAGQEEYDKLRPLSYDDPDVIVICFSLACPESLDNVLLNWVPEVRYFCGNVPILLVGNKKDLRSPPPSPSAENKNESSAAHDTKPYHTPQTSAHVTHILHPASLSEADIGSVPMKRYSKLEDVSFEEGQEVARKMGAVGYFETSAKTGEGTDEVLEALVKAGVEKERKSKKGWRLFGKKKRRY